MGSSITIQRVKNYWAADLPVNKGSYNFDEIRYEYYLDPNVAFEAFKAGTLDFRREGSAKNWATAYTSAWMDKAHIIRAEQKNSIAQPIDGFTYNIQRPIFSDRRVRLALTYFLDFEWINKNLFYNTYQRTRSYFENTIYEARGLPSPLEVTLLAPIKSRIPPEVYTEEYNPPKTDGTGYIRPQARKALALLAEAGWRLSRGKLVDNAGRQFAFELMLYDPQIERVATSFQRNLARYGIAMHIRSVDSSQFVNRLRSRDFDMIARGYGATQTPSADLEIMWNTKYIDSTWNIAGVSDPAIDYLTEAIAANEEDADRLLALGHAFDRVAMWNCYTIPQWNLPAFRIAYRDTLRRPAVAPKYDLGLITWWMEP
jgi:microcin C transport system substrate-binding protein